MLQSNFGYEKSAEGKPLRAFEIVALPPPTGGWRISAVVEQ